MKNKYKLIILLTFIAFTSCESELERLPKDQLTIATTFTNYRNFQTYAWEFYNTFGSYHQGRVDLGEHSADLMVDGRNNNGNNWIWQRITVPTSSGLYSGGFSRIRKVNLMLDNIDNSELNDNEKNHWRSVGYFFRAWEYFDLVKAYGDITWVETALSDADTDVLYGGRTPRNEVTQNMLDNLLYAEENINEDGEGDANPNTIGVDEVRALISRFGLFEGTWRKYHGLGGETPYLQASADASEKLMAAYPALHPNYEQLFSSTNLQGTAGIILHKEYGLNFISHNLNQWSRSSESPFWDFTKKAADMFLMSDGTPVSADPDFVNREKDPYSEFRNRDHRMYFTITPPFQIRVIPGTGNKEWEYLPDPQYREYIDLLGTISNFIDKPLPENNWNGDMVPISPHFRGGVQPGLPFDPGYNTTSSGYKQYKFVNNNHVSIAWLDEHDQPIFRMGEILMNYAEAKFELGEFSQTIADATINQLRARANVADMSVGAITDGFDPMRDTNVDPVLWEIRRERAVELMAEGFRFDDLRRWKKMDYATQEKLGRYIVAADFNNRIPVQVGASEGYVSRIGIPPAWPDYYYLYPIPSNEIVITDGAIEQNPGW